MVDTSWTVHTKSNGTFSIDHITGVPPQIDRGETVTITLNTSNFNLLQDYIKYAGSYTTNEILNGEVYYKENIPSTAAVDSIVFGIEPNTALKNKGVDGLWGIIDGATDSRPQALTNDEMQVGVVVLAPYADYADHTALEGALLM